MKFESTDTRGKVWAVFVYASFNERIRLEQWKNCIQKVGGGGRDGF